MSSFIKFIGCIGLVFLLGAIGSFVTIPNIETWYATLQKPTFNPPNWLFGPVWLTLYILIGISLFTLLTTKTKLDKQKVYLIFGVQLCLNLAWPVAFFGLHSPVWALVTIILLFGAIVLTITESWRINKVAAYLLFPYAAWVGFAMVLNTAIVALN